MEKKSSIKNIKKMSAKGEEVTEKLEKLTGINLREDNDCDDKECCHCSKESDGAESKKAETISKLQDIKDVDLGEDSAMKPLLFKCPNDIYHSIRKDSGEVIIDESCCTVLSVMVKNTGEIATNFSGSHNPDLVKVLSKAVKKYMRELRKKLKSDYKVAREELELRDENIPEEMKFDASKEVKTDRAWNNISDSSEEKDIAKTNETTGKKKSTGKDKADKAKSNSINSTAKSVNRKEKTSSTRSASKTKDSRAK